MIWCEMPQSTFFSEYQIVGVDDEYRDIYLGIVSGTLIKIYNLFKTSRIEWVEKCTLIIFFSANLSRSLVTLKTAKCLKMKLTKKQCPCLTLEIEMVKIISNYILLFSSVAIIKLQI